MKPNSGVYKIVNRANGKCYVGASTALAERFNSHISSLNRGAHYNKTLQAEWSDLGQENFVFEILELTTDKQKLSELEIHFIKLNNSIERGYNSMFHTGLGGAKQSEEMRNALELISNGLSNSEAAAQAGVSRDGIQRTLRKLGIKKKDLVKVK